MSMFDRVLAVTNRHLCTGDFLDQVKRIAAAHPCGLVLREKDLDEDAYQALAADVLRICDTHAVPCMLHRFDRVARVLGCARIHLPLPYLIEHPQAVQGFAVVGVSVHSVDEAKEAVRLGATYLTAGHVFLTDCKKGVPARGLDFLRAVCEAVPVPVYAIGGITPQNAADCFSVGASGVAVMSGVMNGLSDWNI